MNKFDEYLMGLDIGTDSVGWCVSDGNYKVLKYKKNAMWGTSLFDPANQASERRGFRCARRRLDRRNVREQLLRELFSKNICEIDPDFFNRRTQSALQKNDRTCGNDSFIFDNPAADKQFHSDFPTIHHLICELISNKAPHDSRLVYWACSWLLAHRGHFLLDISLDNINTINSGEGPVSELMYWFDSLDYERPFECDCDKLCEIIIVEKRKQERERRLKELLFNGKKPEETLNIIRKIRNLSKTVFRRCMFPLRLDARLSELSISFRK